LPRTCIAATLVALASAAATRSRVILVAFVRYHRGEISLAALQATITEMRYNKTPLL
jgi:hypothetical protein